MNSLVKSLVFMALPAVSFGATPAPQVLQQITTVTASDAAPADQLGTDVAIDGSLIVAGAWGDDAFQGSAYVFRGVAGNVTQEAKLTFSAGQANDLFGRSVDVSGETIAVGASRAFGAEGRVIVFENTSTPANWNEVAVLNGNDLSAADEMGLRVAIDGDRIVAGAPTQLANRGAAYVFRRVGGIWGLEQKLLANFLTPNDLFGIDVAIWGERILVGACGVDVERGATYVFERTGAIWSQVAMLTAQNRLSGDLYGLSVALDGGRAVIGAPQTANGGNGIGFLEVFRLLDGSLSFEDDLTQQNPLVGVGFGRRVDVSGEFVVASRGSSGATGDALLFTASIPGFGSSALVRPAGVALGDDYGGGVEIFNGAGVPTTLLNGGLAIQDRIVVGGARLDDIALNQAEGRVYVSRLNNVFSGYCQGEASSVCGTCPCGNAPSVSSLAGGCLNSDQRSAILSASGNPSLANDTLRFRVFGATSVSFAILQSGPNAPPNVPNPNCAPGSGLSPTNFDGLRCIGGGTTRHGTRPSDANGDIGLTTNGWGSPNPPAGGLLAQNGPVAGQTVYFQAFYRDNPALGCQQGQNTTNGVIVVCLP